MCKDSRKQALLVSDTIMTVSSSGLCGYAIYVVEKWKATLMMEESNDAAKMWRDESRGE